MSINSQRYSLADYVLAVKVPEELSELFADDSNNTFKIGGEGSYLSNISVSLNENMYSTSGDSTGSWVHNRSLNQTGTCSITVSMLAPGASTLKRVCNIYYSSSKFIPGLTLAIQNNNGETLIDMEDCYIQKIPTHAYQSDAQDQTWSFTCGKITFKDL